MLKNTRKRQHCASGHLMLSEWFWEHQVAIIPIGPTEKPIVPVDILSNRYLRNETPWGLIINNVCHVSVDIMELIWNICRRCRDRNFWAISQPNVKNKRSYFAYKNNILGKNELWLSSWESREWKHPKFIKGKQFNLIDFLISVTSLPAASKA